MSFLTDLIRGLYFLARGVLDALMSRTRRRYVTAVDIRAPLDVVWETTCAPSIVFEGPPRIEIATTLRPGTTDTYEGTTTIGDLRLAMAYREIEKRPREGLVIEILKEGSDPAVALGDRYYVACTLAATPEGTRLTMAHELTHTSFSGRFLVPLGAIQNGRRLRRHCEDIAGTSAEPNRNPIAAAVMTGALTYASFLYLFGWEFAAVLLALLVIHEAGHAIAMRLIGQPVQGIYFIPFMGGVAVGAAPHRGEGERGFVALMGPGFSLISTAAFLVGAQVTGEVIFHQLALVSAILNGLNLAPVLPLDGGHVVDAAMSRSDPEMAAIVNVLTLIVGVSTSLYLGWHVLTVLLVLTAPMLIGGGKRLRQAKPISIAGRNWLTAGYLATIAFYAAVAGHLMP